MKFSATTILLATASIVAALPNPNVGNTLLRREAKGAPDKMKCPNTLLDKKEFKKDEIENVLNNLKKTGKYPKELKWKDKKAKIPEVVDNDKCKDAIDPAKQDVKLMEFPILEGGKIFKYGDPDNNAKPGPYRVLFVQDANDRIFCGGTGHTDDNDMFQFDNCEIDD